MLFRICLAIAIVAGLAAGAVTFFKVQDIIVTTRAERDDWHKKDTDEIAAHTKTKATLKTTQAKLDTTEKELVQTKSDLDNANAKVAELDKAKTDLTAKLETRTNERDDAQQKLEAWRILGLQPDEIKAIVADLAKTRQAKEALIGENKLLVAKVNEWEKRWNDFFLNDAPVLLPAGLRGKILAVDPKYDFVVLNIGEDQGAKERGVMMVDRGDKLLGKIRIKTVFKDRCVANILPDWKRGEIEEGDEVLY
jgi:Na+/H+ antiporter NhaB